MNKTKMLRFTRNSALLFAAVSGALYLTGCSSEEGIDPDQKVPESALDTDSYSVYGPNQSRVHNYGNSSTRAEGDSRDKAYFAIDMPEVCPASQGTDLVAQNPAAGSYVAKAESFGPMWLDQGNVTIYVEKGATLKIGSCNGSGNVIYLNDGASLDLTQCQNQIPAKLTVYNYGKDNLIVSPDYQNQKTLFIGGTLYSAKDMNVEKLSMYNTGALYCKGDINVTYDFEAQAKIVVLGNIDCKNYLSNSGVAELYCNGQVNASEKINFDGGNNTTAVACYYKAPNILVNNANVKIITSYIETDNIKFTQGKVVLDNNGLIVVKTDDKAGVLHINNPNVRFTVNGTNAVIAADVLYSDDWNIEKEGNAIFAAEIGLDFGECYHGSEKVEQNKFEFLVSSDDQVVYVPAEGCHGEYGKKPEGPVVEIKKVTDIEPIEDPDHGDHDHGVISATCINFGPDGTAYASYHLRGNGKDADKNPNYPGVKQKGCIEVYKDNGEGGITLGSYMIAPDYDFNHLIVDGDKIITVGNCKKKDAFIGSLPVSFASSEGVQEDFKVKQLTTNEPLYDTSDKTGNQIKVGFTSAGDGNCVVRQGDYYYVATYAGYGPLNLDFSRVNDADGNKIFTKTTGSCKHIAINGGKAAVLSLDTYDMTSSTASVNMFDANDYKFATVLRSYDKVGTVAPVDGKNVVAVDGDNVYACLSQGGLVRLNDGAKFSRGTKVPVNGMAFDDKYVYVANGSFVSVLDKTDLHEVCYYHAANEKSANYIALKNGKIYVAFGENGVQVYQLVEKEITE